MRVFVTGATGLLGRNLLPMLVEHGHDVVALTRSEGRAREFASPTVRPVVGDLRAVEGFEAELRGADVLVHAGACFSEHYAAIQSGSLPFDVNVKGSLALVEAAYRQGVRNIVYVSSGGVLLASAEHAMDEQSPYDKGTADPYFQSKIAAEETLLSFAKDNPALRLVVIMPSVMLGPNDTAPTPTGRFLTAIMRGEVKFLLPGSMSIVDARDVADAIVEAIAHGQSRDRFIVGGRNYPVAQVITSVARLVGREPPTRQPPARLLLGLAHVMGALSRLAHKPAPLRVDTLRRLQQNLRWDSRRAEEVLGVRFRPLEETLRDAVSWFTQEPETRGDAGVRVGAQTAKLRSSSA